MTIPLSVIGTIATDPRFARAGSRTAYCSFRIASHDRRYDRESGQWVDADVNWFTIIAFRGLAEHAHASFAKGDRVIVHGRLRVRRWEAEEKSGTAVEIEADGLGHDLRFGTTTFVRQPARLAVASEPAEERTPASAPETARAIEPGFASLAESSGTPSAPTNGSDTQQDETTSDGFIPSAA
ncbi:single-stranded DNA-binding protein [Leucobacter sp. CSA2]|uniref:Single-stranded DNA-binding protein n=1 Tax=Leucobacter edaphi TaxID=2796472 RepID=A0A934QCV8_9MICO|nr:single-stranded DNA-binding protein [Leucobacter edaphi]MBK0421495.1 single-stranded DNA-binding protein [Leucobacter edaphi]